MVMTIMVESSSQIEGFTTITPFTFVLSMIRNDTNAGPISALPYKSKFRLNDEEGKQQQVVVVDILSVS